MTTQAVTDDEPAASHAQDQPTAGEQPQPPQPPARPKHSKSPEAAKETPAPLPERPARKAAKPGARAVAEPIWLDYGKAARTPKFISNLSCVAVAGEHLWTASDEVRTIEVLAPYRSGYRLKAQYALDDIFPGLPGADEGQEADIEALDFSGGRLWVCGSHSLTRRPQARTRTDVVEKEIHKRPSRRLLGSVPLSKDGGEIAGKAAALPVRGAGNLRKVLGRNPYFAPFMELPSKENGIDIEGLVNFKGKTYIGLRGPVIQNIAVIPALSIGAGMRLSEKDQILHFVDLGGLGVRDLARWKDGLLILAGPVSSADHPFRLYAWSPRVTSKIQRPQLLTAVPQEADHPEGICALPRDGRDGIIVLYDTANPKRVRGSHFRAEWISLR
jgi:hypothetical protein